MREKKSEREKLPVKFFLQCLVIFFYHIWALSSLKATYNCFSLKTGFLSLVCVSYGEPSISEVHTRQQVDLEPGRTGCRPLSVYLLYFIGSENCRSLVDSQLWFFCASLESAKAREFTELVFPTLKINYIMVQWGSLVSLNQCLPSNYHFSCLIHFYTLCFLLSFHFFLAPAKLSNKHRPWVSWSVGEETYRGCIYCFVFLFFVVSRSNNLSWTRAVVGTQESIPQAERNSAWFWFVKMKNLEPICIWSD